MEDDIVTFSFLLCRFGGSVEVLHALDQPFSPVSGGFILQNLAFTQTRTNFVQVRTYEGYSVLPDWGKRGGGGGAPGKEVKK